MVLRWASAFSILRCLAPHRHSCLPEWSYWVTVKHSSVQLSVSTMRPTYWKFFM
jgi:hypothetical protein